MEIFSRINWVDVLVAIIMIRISYVAFRDGLSHEIFPFFGSIIAVVLGIHYYMRLGSFISQNLANVPVEISNFLSFLVLVVAISLLVRFLARFLEVIVKVQWHPVIEKFGGLFVGILKAYIITAMVLTMLVLIPLSYLQWSVKDRSLTGRYVLMAGPEVCSRFKSFLSDNSTVPKKVPAKKEPS